MICISIENYWLPGPAQSITKWMNNFQNILLWLPWHTLASFDLRYSNFCWHRINFFGCKYFSAPLTMNQTDQWWAVTQQIWPIRLNFTHSPCNPLACALLAAAVPVLSPHCSAAFCRPLQSCQTNVSVQRARKITDWKTKASGLEF